MSLLAELIQPPIRIGSAICRKVVTKTDKRLFAFLFNIQSFIIGSRSRVAWNGNTFSVTDNSLPWFKYNIRSRYQCYYAYRDGVINRAQYLGECYFLHRIGFKDGDTIIDCGANVGDLMIWFKLNQIDINYIGFEPSPVEYECLKANVSRSKLINIGLWNAEGESQFYVSSEGADSSIIEPKYWNERISVKIDRLENFISSRVKCLKLEAEGAEPEILEGLGRKLKLVDYISADLGFERGVEEESTLVPVTNYLLTRGFELDYVSHGNRICALFRNTGQSRGKRTKNDKK